jgi:hypothetical protein
LLPLCSKFDSRRLHPEKLSNLDALHSRLPHEASILEMTTRAKRGPSFTVAPLRYRAGDSGQALEGGLLPSILPQEEHMLEDMIQLDANQAP